MMGALSGELRSTGESSSPNAREDGSDSDRPPDGDDSDRPANGAAPDRPSTDDPRPGPADAAAGAGETTSLSTDSIFFILSNSRRRGVIHCLRRVDEPLDVSRLTTLVAAMENGKAPEEVTYSQRKRVYTSLHQSHLPKMDEMGIVTFDRRAGTVAPERGFEEIDVYLEVVPGEELAWSEFYFGVGVLSLAVSMVGWIGVPPFDLVPDLAYVLALSGVLLTASVTQWAHTRTQFDEDELDTGVIEG